MAGRLDGLAVPGVDSVSRAGRGSRCPRRWRHAGLCPHGSGTSTPKGFTLSEGLCTPVVSCRPARQLQPPSLLRGQSPEGPRVPWPRGTLLPSLSPTPHEMPGEDVNSGTQPPTQVRVPSEPKASTGRAAMRFSDWLSLEPRFKDPRGSLSPTSAPGRSGDPQRSPRARRSVGTSQPTTVAAPSVAKPLHASLPVPELSPWSGPGHDQAHPHPVSSSFWSWPGTQAGIQGRMMDFRPEGASTRLNRDPWVAPRTRHQNWELVPAAVTWGLGAEPKSRRTLVRQPPPSGGTQPARERPPGGLRTPSRGGAGGLGVVSARAGELVRPWFCHQPGGVVTVPASQGCEGLRPTGTS